MTDEEMAVEWVKKNSYPYSNCLYIEKKLKQAYLAGLKASKPQWHDLEKDPTDLPKESILVLVMLENGKPITSGISTDKRWFCTDYDTGEDKVIKWCEIPTFYKE